MRKPKQFHQVDTEGGAFSVPRGTMHVRSIKLAAIYQDGTLIGVNAGEFTVKTAEGDVEIASDGDVWVGYCIVNHDRSKTSEQVFTTYDRPATLSPEMQLMQRMMKSNALERERQLKQMEYLHDELSRSRTVLGDSAVVVSPPSEKTEAESDNAKAGKPHTAKQKDEGSRTSSAADTGKKPAGSQRKPNAEEVEE